MSKNQITVPQLASLDLLKHAIQQARLTRRVDDSFKAWNFITDECGKTFEVLTHAFTHSRVSREDIRKHFREKGFSGNTAAFIAWLCGPKSPCGSYMCIPDEDRLPRKSKFGSWVAPSFFQDEKRKNRILGFEQIGDPDYFGGQTIFVAFREIK